jgi:AraC family transcriptional regulator, transcriptional activator of pobA
MTDDLPEFRPVLLEDLEIRWPGFRIRRVALNQHMPRVERFGEHLHDWYQVLLYLRGSGIQHLGATAVPVARGSLLVISPGQSHRFEKLTGLRPVCLVMDFESDEPLRWQSATLTVRDLARVERWLVALHQLGPVRSVPGEQAIPVATLLLRLMNLLRSYATPQVRTAMRPGPVGKAVSGVIEAAGLNGDLRPSAIAIALGRTLDHLNRQLRAEAGMTVGEAIQRARRIRCEELLRKTDQSIGEVGAAIGFDDQNYFARWFRKQTGQSPRRWREVMSLPHR